MIVEGVQYGGAASSVVVRVAVAVRVLAASRRVTENR